MKTTKQFILLLFVVFLSFLAFFHPITTLQEDLGRHLLLGKLILQTGHVPNTNLLSYTYPNYPFINSHWLSEVIFTGIFQVANSFGLLALTTILGVTTFVLLFHYQRKRFGFFSSLVTFLLTLLLFFDRVEVRPQIFSYILTTVFLVILFMNKQRSTKWLFVLIPLELLWVNMHIYFIIGPLLIVLFLLQALQTKNQTKPLVITLLATLTVTLFNPNFLKGALFPLTFWQNYGLPIGENVSALFALRHFIYPPVYVFCFELGLLILLLCIYRKKTDLLDWLLIGFCSVFGLVAVRNLPLFALGAAIPFAKTLSLAQKQLFSRKLIQFHLIFRFSQTFFVLVLFVSTVFILSKQGFGYRLIDNYKPGIDYFRNHNLKGPIFNNFDIGSYLDYRLYPRERVFVDNRPEAYPAGFFQNIYLPMETAPNRFYQIDKTYHFQTIIFGKIDQSAEGKKFLLWIKKDKQWTKVYEDQTIVILRRN